MSVPHRQFTSGAATAGTSQGRPVFRWGGRLATGLSVAWCMIGTSASADRFFSGRGEFTVSITSQRVKEHVFLERLYPDAYFPDHVLDKGVAILRRLCERIEAEQPADLTALYVLTEAATEEFNALEAEFDAAGSEIETVAREEIAEDFWFVASAYGFADADAEELIAGRDW
jgi:hypothetical protein